MRPPEVLDDARIAAWRSLLTHEDFARCLGLVQELDRTDPRAGWGSLDREDVMRNVPLLLQVIEQRESCAACPGLAACKVQPGFPRGTVARRLEPHVLDTGVVVLRARFGACDLQRGLAAQQADEYNSRRARRRRRAEGEADGRDD